MNNPYNNGPAPKDCPASSAQRHVGDVTIGEDGRMYAVTLDNSGRFVWTCIDVDENMQAIMVALLKTIKWSAHYYNMLKSPSGDWLSQQQQNSAAGKPRRKKTAYNKHIGEVLRSLAKNEPTMPRKERMRVAVASWKSRSSGGAGGGGGGDYSVIPRKGEGEKSEKDTDSEKIEVARLLQSVHRTISRRNSVESQ